MPVAFPDSHDIMARVSRERNSVFPDIIALVNVQGEVRWSQHNLHGEAWTNPWTAELGAPADFWTGGKFL